MSEFYARDTSKKIKAVAHAKGNADKRHAPKGTVEPAMSASSGGPETPSALRGWGKDFPNKLHRAMPKRY